MADLYGTNNDRSFSSSSSLESEDMSSFFQSFLDNSSAKAKYGQLLPSPSQISTDFLDSDQRFSDLTSFYNPESTNQVQKLAEVRPNSNPTRSSKRTRAAEIHNLSEKRRRSRINEKLKALQTLVPNSNKTDKASMLDEAIEYLKQLQLKVQTLTMRNGYGLPPICSQEQEMQRAAGYNDGYKLPNPSEGFATFSQNQVFSTRREFGMTNHIDMPTLTTNMVKPDSFFGSETANVNQFGLTNHSTLMKDIDRPSKPFTGKINSPGISS